MDIRELTDVMKDGNYYYNRSIEIAEKQAMIAKKQAVIGEKNSVIAEKNVMIAEKQAKIVEKGLAILEQSKPRYYSENEVWSELEKLGVMLELRMRCYRFLCREDKAKREFFGIPFEMRLTTLYELMKEAGAF